MSEIHSQSQRERWSKTSVSKKSKIARKVALAAHAKRTPEERSAIARKGRETFFSKMTPKQRSRYGKELVSKRINA